MLLLAMTLAARAQEGPPPDEDADRVGLGAFVGGTFSGAGDVGGALRWRPTRGFAVEPTAFVSREAYTLDEAGVSVSVGYDRKLAWGAGVTARIGRPRVAGLVGVEVAEQRSWYAESDGPLGDQRQLYRVASVLGGVGFDRRIAPKVTVGADVLVPVVSTTRWRVDAGDGSATYDALVVGFDPRVRLTVLFWP